MSAFYCRHGLILKASLKCLQILERKSENIIVKNCGGSEILHTLQFSFHSFIDTGKRSQHPEPEIKLEK